MRSFAPKLWFAFAAILFSGSISHGAHAAGGACFQDSVRAMALASWGWNGGYMTKDADAALDFIKSEGANTVFVLRPYDVNFATSQIEQVSASDDMHGPPSDTIIIHAIQNAGAHGLDAGLKLHFINPKSGDVLANAEYVPKDPAVFFSDFKKVALANAALAEKYGVKILILGTEMGGDLTADPKFKPYFEDTIAAVRQVFHGKITFATQISTHVVKVAGNGNLFGMIACIDKKSGANWCVESNEADYLSFWQDLDYIGIDVYPNFTKKTSPTQDEIRAGFYNDVDGQSMIGLLESIQSKNGGKPILITEIGAASVDGAQTCSGCWPSTTKPPDFKLQSDIITVDADVLCKEKQAGHLNLAGITWWEVEAYKNSHAQQSPLGVDERGFAFRNKPAGDVIKAYFTGTAPSP
jgi:hypothetical protein